jgi:hypothetical protein
MSEHPDTDYVWIWDGFVSCWRHCLRYTAETFRRMKPERYGEILEEDRIPKPEVSGVDE